MLLGAVGVTLVVPRLAVRLGVFLGPVARLGSRIVSNGSGTGLGGGVILGGAIGLIWARFVVHQDLQTIFCPRSYRRQ